MKLLKSLINLLFPRTCAACGTLLLEGEDTVCTTCRFLLPKTGYEQHSDNPLAQILSVAMLYEHFGLNEEGALIRKAVQASLDANVRTPEIQIEGGAKYGTREVGQWIVDYIEKN